LTSQTDVITEVQQNFIDSSYDVNANRAFPDIRDGLKPGQRACLWEMYTKKYTSSKPHVKSAKISGGVAALWWPHGTTAIYETFARMSQPFINNLPEVDFHGANGNVILGGDALAADRYTEARLAPIVEQGMFQSMNKQPVPMIKNFSEDEEWPKVLPAVFPRLLVNGSQGIGVSLAQVWLPHNFTETANLILDYIATGELKEDTYYPDFPTGGLIINQDELPKINKTGKGRVIVEARYKIDGQTINFYEMPYQVFIEPVIDQIKKAIEEEKIEGISEVFNKSDKKRLLLSVECDSGFSPEKVVAQLFNETDLRKQYNANQNGIISKTPVLVNLQYYVDCYIVHNETCIRRESEFDLKKTQERIEILEGLAKALEDIDNVIQIIKQSKTSAIAGEALKAKYSLTDRQTKAILDMRLSKLANMERIAILNELEEKRELALQLQEIIKSVEKRKKILADRLTTLRDNFMTPRKSEICQKAIASSTSSRKVKEQIIEDVVICVTDDGYVKNIPVKAFTNRAYKTVIKARTDEMLLFFSSLGKAYRLKVAEIKQCTSKDKGTAIGALLNLENGEEILLVTSMNIDEKHPYIAGFTELGMVKKSDKSIYIGSTQNKNGFKCANLKDGDKFIHFQETNGDYACLYTDGGRAIQFKMDDVNTTGKTARGVIAIKLDDSAKVTSVVISPKENTKLPVQNRAGKGVKYSA